MCLAKITKKYDTPDMDVRTGYKFLLKGLITPYRETQLSIEWQKAEETRVSSYTSGYHVFPTRSAARKALRILKTLGGHTSSLPLSIWKVEVKGVTYEGFDGTSMSFAYVDARIPTIVAQWIRVIPGKV